MNPTDPKTWWRYRDRITGREVKCLSAFPFPGMEPMREWVAAPFDPAEHGNGVLYPVPIQNVQHRCKTPAVYAPAPRRSSVLIRRATIPRIVIAKG
jgi:hypothetical protein